MRGRRESRRFASEREKRKTENKGASRRLNEDKVRNSADDRNIVRVSRI